MVPVAFGRALLDGHQFHRVAELYQPSLRLERVLFRRHDAVVQADDMAQRDLRLRDRLEHIHRVAAIRAQFRLVLEAVNFSASGGFLLRAGPAERPALQIHHRRVRVDAGDAVRMARGVAVSVQAAAADRLERRPPGESAVLRQVRVEPSIKSSAASQPSRSRHSM